MISSGRLFENLCIRLAFLPQGSTESSEPLVVPKTIKAAIHRQYTNRHKPHILEIKDKAVPLFSRCLTVVW